MKKRSILPIACLALLLVAVEHQGVQNTPKTTPDTFEVASIRPSPAPPASPGARGGGGIPIELPCPTANVMEMEFFFQLTPDRLVMKMQSLYSLIALAYASSCPAPNTLSGGMDWMRTENYELQATFPAGTPRYTKEQLLSGNAPRLQRMLQNLLADRFKLVLKRELKEMQGYNLVLAQPGKLKPSGDQTPDQPPPTPGRGGAIRQVRGPIIPSMAAPISRLVSMLQRTMGGPIVDKTGLTGLYDIFLEFPEIELGTLPADGAPRPNPAPGVDPLRERVKDALPTKLEATTGLKLQPAKVPTEVLVIVSAEKPSAN